MDVLRICLCATAFPRGSPPARCGDTRWMWTEEGRLEESDRATLFRETHLDM